jgi:hypothetical protein
MVRERTANGLSALWLVRGAVLATLDARWAVSGQISRSLALSWIVRGQVVAAVELLWVSEAVSLPTERVPADVTAQLTDRFTANANGLDPVFAGADNLVYRRPERIVADFREV